MSDSLPPTGASARVLIVEDDPDVQHFLGEALVNLGHTVHQARCLADVRACLATFQPDVILLDAHLPDGRGLDLLPEIHLHWPAAAVLMISGSGILGLPAEALRRGAVGFLNKPFGLEELTEALKQVLKTKAR